MLNCRQVTRLVSQGLDAKLSWPQRLGVRLHLLYCVWCRRYAAQLRILRKAGKQLASEMLETPVEKLSDAAKDQLRARLRQALKDLPPSTQ